MALHRRIFFLLIVLFPTQLGIHFWPEWAHILGRRVDYLSPTLFLTDILIFLLVCAWAVSGLAKRDTAPREKLGSLGRYGKYVLFAVVLFASVNSYFASSPWVAAYEWVKVLEFVGLGWYIITTKPKIAHIVLPLSLGVLYSSLSAIGQFLLQRSIGGPLWLLGERTFDIETPGIARWEGFGKLLLRPYATFPHPNVLGGYLATMLPVIIQYSNYPIHKLSNKKTPYFTVIIALGIIALLLTFSRSAWIIVAGALLFVAWRKKTSVLVITSMMLVALFLWFRPSTADESVVQRARLNEAAISMWQRAPLVGVGLGNFVVELPRQSLNRYGNFLQPVHNIYLLVLSETGILGTLLFLWVLNKGIRGAWGTTGKLPLITFLLLGLVDHYPVTLQQGQLLFTLVLALSMLK